MSYIFKFEEDDIFLNTVRSYPQVEFYIYSGSAYYNDNVPIKGIFANSVDSEIRAAPYSGSTLSMRPGNISLYEMNVDRSGSLDFSGPSNTLLNPLEEAVLANVDPAMTINSGSGRSLYGASRTYVTKVAGGAAGSPLIQPFLVKDGTRINFRSVSSTTFNQGTQYGDIITKQYPLTASITKEFFLASTRRQIQDVVVPATGTPAGFSTTFKGYVSHLLALTNTINHYRILSPHFVVSSSTIIAGGGRNLTASSLQVHPHDGVATAVGLLSIPSIFYGSSIKQGSISMKFYVTGTLVGELQDINRNGELIQTGPPGSPYSGSVAGLALYKEGFLILTGSWNLSTHIVDNYLGRSPAANYSAKWIYFGNSLPGAVERLTSPYGHSVFLPNTTNTLKFKGTTRTPTLTMLAHAPKNLLNHSNNPTYSASGSVLLISTGSTAYIEYPKREIKNTVSSSYNDPTGSFKKTTYISQIGIYDKNKNLIAIAKVATPIKKTEDRDFTFKLKMDL